MALELRIKDIATTISSMCPVKVYVNENCIFDDDKVTQPLVIDKEWAKYEEFLKTSQDLVNSIKFDICDFHHSIVHIKTY